MQSFKKFNRRRRDILLHMGAALSPNDLKRVRRWRWFMVISGALMFALGGFTLVVDRDWVAGLFFCGIAAFGGLLGWTGLGLMLEGHAIRHELDTRGRRRFNPDSISRSAALGASGGGGALLLGYDWIVEQWQALLQSWPWF